MRFWSIESLLIICVMCSSLSWAASKKKKKGDEEPVTQVLDFPKDPPAAIVADASRMTFFISALSAKGLLSAQIRDAIRNLMGQSRGAQIVKLRAFVAGSGDLRRVPSLVSEIFTDKRLPLPAVTVVQVGALPLTGAQVLIEATAVDRKPTNPNGLAFIGGQPGSASGVGARLASMLGKASIRAQSVRQVTCFLDGLEFESSVRDQIATAYPRAPAAYVQLRRDSAGEYTECEAVTALENIPVTAGSGGAVTFVGPVRVALTGAQMGFGGEDKDIALAFDRLGRALEGVGASWKSVVMANTYALSNGIRRKVGAARNVLGKSQQPGTGLSLVFEGLPSVDASFAIDAVAYVER